MDRINPVDLIPISSSLAQAQPVDPILQFLIKQIDDTITKAKEAAAALELKIDQELGSIKGFLLSKDSTDSEAVTKGGEEVNELQQQETGLKYAINDLLDLKQKLAELEKKYKSGAISEIKKEISEIEDQIKIELNKIKQFINKLDLK